MPHTQEVTPHRVLLPLNPVSPNVYYFTDPIRGRPYTLPKNYTLVDEPSGIPGYSMSIIQDWYKTPNPVFLVTIFLNNEELFFSESDSYYTITTVDRRRPDIISYRFYGTVDYFWIILLANNVLDPFDIEINTILRIPSPSTVLSKWLVRPVSQVRNAIN